MARLAGSSPRPRVQSIEERCEFIDLPLAYGSDNTATNDGEAIHSPVMPLNRWTGFSLSVCIHVVFLLFVLVFGSIHRDGPKPEDIRKGATKVVSILPEILKAAPKDNKADEHKPQSKLQKETLPKLSPPLDTSTALADQPSTITVEFQPDRDQSLPTVLARSGGLLGFGDEYLIERMFRAPDWSSVSVFPHGRTLKGYFHFAIDERFGRYSFIDEVRSREDGVRKLQAYALFEFGLQLRLESEIRRIGERRCSPKESLRAVLKLDASSDIRIEEVSCVVAEKPEPKR
jgi:hypothetical protein